MECSISLSASHPKQGPSTLFDNYFLEAEFPETMSGRITNNNVIYNSIVFCLQKNPVHNWKADAFDNWAFVHGAAEDGHINSLLKTKASHLLGIYGGGEPGPDFSIIVQRGEDKKVLDTS